MTLIEAIEFVKYGGSIAAPLLLIALIWMNSERKDAIAETREANSKLANLSERTIVLLTEIKLSLFGQNK